MLTTLDTIFYFYFYFFAFLYMISLLLRRLVAVYFEGEEGDGSFQEMLRVYSVIH